MESFGITILEATCAGLYVVSIGVPEILLEDIISFAEPEEDGMSYLLLSFSVSDAVLIADVFRAISEAIEIIFDGKHNPILAHEWIKTFCAWAQVTERTEVVSDTVVKSRQVELWERMMVSLIFREEIFIFLILSLQCLRRSHLTDGEPWGEGERLSKCRMSALSFAHEFLCTVAQSLEFDKQVERAIGLE